MVSACGRRSREVVGRRGWIGGGGPQIEQFWRSEIDPVRRNDIVQERSGSGVASRASSLRVHDSSTRIVNLVDHHRLAACVHASIVANARRKPGLAYFRKISRAFVRVRNCSGEWRSCSQTKPFGAEKPECFISPAEMRNVQRTAGVCSELILYPRRSRLPGGIQKKIVGIEDFVAEIFVRFSVNGACAGLGAEVGHAAGELSPFRRQDCWSAL